jgi:hypothetical protein
MARIQTNTSYDFEIGQSVRVHYPIAQLGGPPVAAKIAKINGDRTVDVTPIQTRFQRSRLEEQVCRHIPVVARGSLDPNSPYITDSSIWCELVLGMDDRENDKPMHPALALSMTEKAEAPVPLTLPAEPETEQNDEPKPAEMELYQDFDRMPLAWEGEGNGGVGTSYRATLEVSEDEEYRIEIVHEDDETRGVKYWLVNSDADSIESHEFASSDDAIAYVERAATAIVMAD